MRWVHLAPRAILIAYLAVGIIIAIRYTRETLADIENIPRSGTYKLGQQIGAYVFFPVCIVVWPIYFVPNSWVGGKD